MKQENQKNQNNNALAAKHAKLVNEIFTNEEETPEVLARRGQQLKGIMNELLAAGVDCMIPNYLDAETSDIELGQSWLNKPVMEVPNE